MRMVGLIKKFHTFSHDVIFVDGLWGTGKSVIMPIIGGMDRMEKPRSDPSYEWLCALGSYKKIEPDALTALLNTYADMHQYHNRIGREVNLRWADETGLKNNPGSFKYIKRLLGSEGESMTKDIEQRNLGLLIMSHMILPVSYPLVDAFGSRLKIIEIVRHPLYIVRHWYNYFKRNPKEREFTISFDCEGEKIPWFAGTWKEEYVNCSLIDKCLASIIFLFNALFEGIDKLKEKNQDILVISFESFVLEPQENLKNLESYLGRKHHKNIKAILKKQNVPRKQVVGMKGIALYGWKPSESKSDAEEYAKQMEFICREGSKEYIEKFNTLISMYNQKWPSVLSQFQ
jgi:hypothetical protein